MTQQEIFELTQKKAEQDDFDGVFELAEQMTEEPLRSAAYKLIVDMILVPKFKYRLGEGIVDSAYRLADNYITDPELRIECMKKIMKAAERWQDWETYRKVFRAVADYIFRKD